MNRRCFALLRPLVLAGLLLFSSLAAVPAACGEAAMTGGARQLAQKLAADLSAKQPWHFEFRDLTDSSVADFNEARQAFEAELTSHGFHLVPSAPAENSVRVTLSKDPQEGLWIAEFLRDGKADVEIVPFTLIAMGAATLPPPISIQRQFVFEQPSPFFDFVWAGPPDSNSPLLVLGPAGVSLLRYNKPQWQLQASVSLSQQRALSRDAQGQVTFSGGAFEARVADVFCTGTIADIAAMQCNAGPQNVWRFQGADGASVSAIPASARNWFAWSATAGAASDASRRVPFFSLAALGAGGQSLWVASGVDGKTRVYTGAITDPLATVAGWGSTLAGIHSNCGNGWQVLATRAGDYASPDAVQAFEWSGKEFRAAGAAIEFDGPVVAMQPDADSGETRAVVHNLKSGNYEGYTLKVSCGR